MCYRCARVLTWSQQHAFWLIYKKMQAEERYGRGGYICTSHCPVSPIHALLAYACCGCRCRQWRVPARVQPDAPAGPAQLRRYGWVPPVGLGSELARSAVRRCHRTDRLPLACSIHYSVRPIRSSYSSSDLVYVWNCMNSFDDPSYIENVLFHVGSSRKSSCYPFQTHR